MAFAKLKTYRNENRTGTEGDSQPARPGDWEHNEQVNIMDSTQRTESCIAYIYMYTIYTPQQAIDEVSACLPAASFSLSLSLLQRAIKSRLQFVLLISMLLALFARRKLSLTSNRYAWVAKAGVGAAAAGGDQEDTQRRNSRKQPAYISS